MFDHSCYLKYLFKYVILYVVFKLYLVIKQIITKYITIFKFFEQDKWSNVIQKVNGDKKKNGGSSLFVNRCLAFFTTLMVARGRETRWGPTDWSAGVLGM
jgi:hypothetical protein